jgi:hypothetical protein
MTTQFIKAFEVLRTSTDYGKLLAIHSSNSPDQLTSAQQLALTEVEILHGLVSDDNETVIQSIKDKPANTNNPLFIVEDISDDMFSDIMISKKIPNPDIAMALQYETASRPDSIVDFFISTQANPPVKEVCELDKETTPLFTAKIEIVNKDALKNGDNYNTIIADKSGLLNTNIKSHNILLDSTDPEYVLFKYRNSPKGSALEEGIKANFDNDFNATTAFLTPNIITRDLATNKLTSGLYYQDYFEDKLEVAEVSNANPMFGGLKFVQGPSYVTTPSNNNNIDAQSTIASLEGGIETILTAPATESEFSQLFTEGELSKVKNGYKVALIIGNQEKGGYSLNSKNSVLDVKYDNNNTPSSSNSPIEIFTLDDSDILNNYLYMNAMKKNNNEFLQHEIYLHNGDFVVDSLSLNPNKDNFTVLDGTEQLTVNNDLGGFSELTANGVINVKQSNNILNHPDARWSKDLNGSPHVKSLTVTYPDEQGEAGTLSVELRKNYHVESKVAVLTKTTRTEDAPHVWSSMGTTLPKFADNTVLLPRDGSVSNRDDIMNFNAPGLNNLLTDNKFALVQVQQTHNYFGNMVEAVLTANNVQLQVVSDVRFSDIDLISLDKKDLRISIMPKNVSDLPSLAVDHGASFQTTAGPNDHLNYNYNDGLFTNGNGGFLTSSTSSAETGWGPNISADTHITDPVNVLIKYKVDQSNTNRFNISITSDTTTIDTVVEGEDIKIFDEVFAEQPSPPEPTTIVEGIVKRYTETKKFKAAIKLRVGAYSNLWYVIPVTQRTVTWKLFDSADRQLPDYFLKRIKVDGSCPYQTTKTFVNIANQEVSELNSFCNFKIADLFVAKATVQYKDAAGAWVSFDSDGRDDLDLVFDTNTKLNFKPSGQSSASTAHIIIDALNKDLTFGEVPLQLLQEQKPILYTIELTTASGTTTFNASGYIYDIAHDAKWLPEDWSPSSTNKLFLQDGFDDRVGTELTLTTDVVYGDLSTDPSVPRFVTVNIYQNRNNLIASFTSNQLIIDSFNIFSCKSGQIVRHRYINADTAPTQKTYTEEYLPSVRRSSSLSGEEYYCKLKYGFNYEGVLVNLDKAVLPNSESTFKLRGDKVNINLLKDAVINPYNGRYSSYDEILPSETGVPLSTNSSIHRNIGPNWFRGYTNSDEPIVVIRSPTAVKLVIGNEYQDDMNIFDDTNVAYVWANRELVSSDIYKPASRDISNMNPVFNQSRVDNSSIGGIGLKLRTGYSMFPRSINTTGAPYRIPITTTAANYNLIVGETTFGGDLFKVVLNKFVNKSLVARRIKVRNVEKFEFIYNFGTMTIYTSPEYIGTPSSFNWAATPLASNVTDARLRQTGFTAGIYNFKRILNYTGAYTRYAVLPRPIANVIANNIQSTVVERYVDIDLQNGCFPFTGLTQINQLKLSFDDDLTYADLKLEQPRCNFTIPTDIINIYMSVGVDDSYKQLLFEGPASELGNALSWKISNFSGSFSDKNWNIKFEQPSISVNGGTAFMSIPTSITGQKNISIKNIPSFALSDVKTLTLRPLQSVKCCFYEMDIEHERDSLNFIVNFKKFSTVSEGVSGNRPDDINFGDSFGIEPLKYQTFNPLITQVEYYTIPVKISDVLFDTRRNVFELFKVAAGHLLDSLVTVPWKNPVAISSPYKRSAVTLAPLTIKGHKKLLEFLYVSQKNYLKILTFTRPNMYKVISPDGFNLLNITPDGIVDNFSTNQIHLIDLYDYKDKDIQPL